MADFADVFMDYDVQIMKLLGDDIVVVTPGNTPVTVRGVIVNEVDDEALIDRFEMDIHTLEILSTDLGIIESDSVITYAGVNYSYLTDQPKGTGRHLIILKEEF